RRPGGAGAVGKVRAPGTGTDCVANVGAHPLRAFGKSPQRSRTRRSFGPRRKRSRLNSAATPHRAVRLPPPPPPPPLPLHPPPPGGALGPASRSELDTRRRLRRRCSWEQHSPGVLTVWHIE